MADFFDWAIPLAATGASLYFGNKAANAASDASDAAVANTRQMFDISREDLTPYRETGSQALFGLADLFGVPRPNGAGGFTAGKAFQESPGYQFRLGEGIKALDRSAAARGMLRSGAQQKAIEQYGQNLASDEWQNYTRTLQSLAGVGQTATNTGVAANSSAAGAINSALQSGAQGQAYGYINTGNSLNSLAGNLAYVYGRK